MMALVAMMTLSIHAQDGYEDTKQELAVTYGIYSNSQWLDVFEDLGMVITGARLHDDSFIGPLSVEYFYHAKKWLGVGAIAVFGTNNQEIYLGGKKPENYYGESNNTYYTLMPAVKFDWLRKKHFGMYSKVAVGATYRHDSVKKTVDHKDFSDNSVHFNWHLTAIGLEAGSPYVRGFLEVGNGEQGMFLLGVRYKFN